MSDKPAKLWGGRFAGGLHPIFDELNRSLPFDRRLVFQDIDGSVAWANGLAQAGVLNADEAAKLVSTLGEIRAELEKDPSPIDASRAEDVHSFIEETLVARVGDLGKKLHTGRSRNDQVATDLKLYLRGWLTDVQGEFQALQLSLVELASAHADAALPGYTHLQRAQPVTFGHQCLAYVEMLARDAERLRDAAGRMDACPLGSGALAGTAYPVDRDGLSRALGFARTTHNSLDAVSDRDHVLEIIFGCLTAMLHLSRLAEDWIFLASQESAVLRFGDTVSTGSSLMPQKRNPDALELLRGKVGRVHGALTTLVTTTKGLPLAYDKDLQEDKEALFDALDTTTACLRVAKLVAEDVVFDRTRALAATRVGYLDATDLADLMVGRGVPFREAHDRVGQAVNAAIEEGVELGELSAAARAAVMPELEGVDLAAELTTEAMLSRRDVIGGTAVERVRDEVAAWKKRLSSPA
ncbi:Argininosuccinate lyase [Planctomycetes bacterium Poly30]|uniref:Argininosuccinate lyase n=1 Tax=Saltatorellus ferox TaxID=2528018 RepID=A0A518EYQ0_9BACT|nr:Argininosuccinate lyase [Planctomycetes bacterium Poly30]